MAAEQEAGGLGALQKNQFFADFLKEEFDPTTYSSTVLHRGHASEASRRLAEGIEVLESELRDEVTSRYSELLLQVSSLKDSETALSTVKSGVGALQMSIERVRAELAEPCRLIKLRMAQLNNLHSTIEILRLVVRLLKLEQKLQQHLKQNTDLAKAAQIFHEAEGILSEEGLKGIDIVSKQEIMLREAETHIIQQADKMLREGLESLSQAEVGSGLQVFFNLETLENAVHDVLRRQTTKLSQVASSTVDMATIASASGGSGRRDASAARWKETFWTGLEKAMDQLKEPVVTVWHLQRVLSKKRDPVSHVCFLDVVVKPGAKSLTQVFWSSLCDVIGQHFSHAYKTHAFLRDTLTEGYPHALKLFKGLFDSLQSETAIKGVQCAVLTGDWENLQGRLKLYEDTYVKASEQRCMDAVASLFSSGRSLPSTEAVRKVFLARVEQELYDVTPSYAGSVRISIVEGISKAVSNFAERCEYYIATGSEARQVQSSANNAQLRNFSLSSLLQDLHESLLSLPVPQDSVEFLGPAMEKVYNMAGDCLTPLVRVMMERLELCLLQVHGEGYHTDEKDTTLPSKYVVDFSELLRHFRAEFLQPARLGMAHRSKGSSAIPGLGVALARKMASRCLVFFVRHASMAKPVTEGGKLRLTRDMAELELCVSQNLFPVEQLGPPYRALRALRPLLFLELAAISESPLLQELPLHVVLHHLIARATMDLQMPFERMNLMPAQYSLWLDEHDEMDAWKGVKACLDAYAKKTTSAGASSFDPVYPIILALGAKLEKQVTNAQRGA